MLDEPLDLFFDHLFRGQEHVLEDFDQLGLELGVGDLLPHFHDLDDGFLGAQDAELNDAVVVFFPRTFGGELKTTDQIDLAASGLDKCQFKDKSINLTKLMATNNLSSNFK